jgi:uncharacterized protein YhfF
MSEPSVADAPDAEPDPEIRAFWDLAKFHARLNPAPSYFGPSPLESVPPPAWSFGGTPELADELAALVREGRKTATAGALWDYETSGEPLPRTGDLSIILDGAGHPVALVATTHVEVVPFDEVDAEHAHLEGEGERTLEQWRRDHEWFFSEHKEHDRPFSTTMPVVCERFEVLYLAEGAG